MDFSKILNIAANNKQKQVVVKRYSTEVSAPKKLQRGNVQSEAIKAFIQRKEEEERRKAVEASRKKEELLSLRAAAKHNRRASAMARRTKDNNFAAKFEDRNEADCEHQTKVPSCDVEKSILRNEKQLICRSRQVVDEFEDRVSSKNGLNYKSCERNKPLSISEKEKINKMVLPRVKNERVSVHRTEERESTPRKDNSVPSKVKNKPAPQGQLDFFTLLKIANEKQHEPINIPKKKVVESHNNRPMTQEEKDRLLEESNHRAGKSNTSVIPKKRTGSEMKSEKGKKSTVNVPKPSSDTSLRDRTKGSTFRQQPSDHSVKNNCKPTVNSSNNLANKVHPNSSKIVAKRKVESPNVPKKDVRQAISEKIAHRSTTVGSTPGKPVVKTNNPPQMAKASIPARQNSHLGQKNHPGKSLHAQNGQRVKSTEVFDRRSQDHSRSLPIKQTPPPPSKRCPSRPVPDKHPPSRDKQPKQFPPRDTLVKQFPPKDIRTRQFPPKDIPVRQFPPRDIPMFKRPLKPPMKRRIEEDEDDDDMDEFIDDGPCEEEDYSKHIREIFGYDRRRYMYEEDDVDNMESSFTQQMKEEAYSARIGLLEDLEDIKREEMELARKKRKIR